MAKVTIHEAKTHLSKLLRQVAAGEEVIISRGNEPVAKLVPISRPAKKRIPDLYKGEIWMADDFNELPEDLLKAFEGGE